MTCARARSPIPRACRRARAQAPPPGIEAVTLRLFPGGRAAEAEALAARIAALRGADAEASVAVLVAAHAHAVPIIAALESRGLPVLGVDLVPLRERAVVRDLVAPHARAL